MGVMLYTVELEDTKFEFDLDNFLISEGHLLLTITQAEKGDPKYSKTYRPETTIRIRPKREDVLKMIRHLEVLL